MFLYELDKREVLAFFSFFFKKKVGLDRPSSTAWTRNFIYDPQHFDTQKPYYDLYVKTHVIIIIPLFVASIVSLRGACSLYTVQHK